MMREYLCLAAAMCSGAACAGVVAPELARAMEGRGQDERLPVIVQLADRVDLLQYATLGRVVRDNRLLQALKARSAHSMMLLGPRLDEAQAEARRPLWINNSVAALVPVGAIPALARLPQVARIQYDATVRLAALPYAGDDASIGWTFASLPGLWPLRAQGAGLVVAGMDTGVDLGQAGLAARWRGGANSWFDPFGEFPFPADPYGHGTLTMRLLAGGANGAFRGIAPGARWIAARIFDSSGQSTLSIIHQAFQWLLDPDGDPATVDAPDVVDASWALGAAAPGPCGAEFIDDVAALASAGIVVVCPAGGQPGTIAAEAGADPVLALAVSRLSVALAAATPVDAPAAAQGQGDDAATLASDPAATDAPATQLEGASDAHRPVFTSLPLMHAAEKDPYLYQAGATDPDGGRLVYGLAAAPAGMTIDEATGLVAWTPTKTQAGDNRVVVTATGAGGQSASQGFSILVAANSVPLAAPDRFSVAACGTLEVPAPGVLGNDSDADGDALTALVEAEPAHGELALDASGGFRYTPAASFDGSDSFSYRASDGKASSAVTKVSINARAAGTATNGGCATASPPPVSQDGARAPAPPPVRPRATGGACNDCHRRSGDGNADGPLVVRPIRVHAAPAGSPPHAAADVIAAPVPERGASAAPTRQETEP